LDRIRDLWTPLDRVGDLWRPLVRVGDFWAGLESCGQDLDNATQACRPFETFGQYLDKAGRARRPLARARTTLGMVGVLWIALETFGQSWKPLYSIWSSLGRLTEYWRQCLDKSGRACSPLVRVRTTLGRVGDLWGALGTSGHGWRP
jgi:hypothetical protein